MDLSFLIEVVPEVETSTECSLSALVEVEKVPYNKTLGKIKISALTREDFANRPEIISKYFRFNNRALDRFHIPELSDAEHEAILKNIKFTEKTIKNKTKATASDYYIRKARLMAVAKDLNCNFQQLDTTDYIWDDRYYVTYNFINNIQIVDEWYRDNNEDDRYSVTDSEVYIKEDPRTAVIDTNLWDELYGFCISTIRQRKAMLFGKVDKCLGCLRNVLEYTNGFVENPTRQMVASLKGYQTYFEEMLTDEDFKEFLRTENDITVYGDSELTHSDYVQSYKALVKGLVSGTDSDLKSLVDILNGMSDPYIDEILEELPEISFKAWELDIEDEE